MRLQGQWQWYNKIILKHTIVYLCYRWQLANSEDEGFVAERNERAKRIRNNSTCIKVLKISILDKFCKVFNCAFWRVFSFTYTRIVNPLTWKIEQVNSNNFLFKRPEAWMKLHYRNIGICLNNLRVRIRKSILQKLDFELCREKETIWF